MKGNKLLITGFWIIPVLVFTMLSLFWGYNGLYGQDGHEYLRYCRELLAHFQGAPIESRFFWPVGYPLMGAVLAFFIRSPELAMALIPLLSLGGTGWMTWAILEKLYPQSTFPKATFIFIFMIMSPFMLRGGVVVMSDLSATFFVTGAFYAFLSLSGKWRWQHFTMFVVFSALALLTRYPAAFLLVFPAIGTLFITARSGKAGWLLMGAILAVVCLSPHFLFRVEGDLSPQHMELGWSVENFFRSSFQSTEGLREYRLPNLLYAFGNLFHPGYIFAGLILLPFIRLKDFGSGVVKIICAGLLLYAFFIAGMAYQNQRFLIISFPVVIMILYPAFSRLWEMHCPKWMKNLVWIAVLIVQCGLFVYSINPILKRNQLEKKLVNMVRLYKPSVLYTFDVDQALRSYRVTGEVKSLWKERYQAYEKGAMVLFNESAFARQWEGHNPMLNWKDMKNSYRLELVAETDDGWELFRIEEKEEDNER